MALSKIQPASIDLTANYAFTGTNSISTIAYEEKKLATLTASSSSTLSFTSSIDNTYNIYKFRFIDIHGSSNDRQFRFTKMTLTMINLQIHKRFKIFILKIKFIRYLRCAFRCAQGRGY